MYSYGNIHVYSSTYHWSPTIGFICCLILLLNTAVINLYDCIFCLKYLISKIIRIYKIIDMFLIPPQIVTELKPRIIA